MVYIELHDTAMFLQDEVQVDGYTWVANDVQRVALNPEQSREVIASMLKL